jgi:aspartate-semialdehyde dehydrogenase
MECKKEYSIAVVGATGNAGMKTLQILAERNFPISNVIAIASERSIGKFVSFKEKTIAVQRFPDVDFSKVDIAFFCAGSRFSAKNAEAVANLGCVIIDKTSYFRLNPKVPLIVPEINANDLKNGAPLGIISTPNCVVVPLAMTLKALSNMAPIERVVVSTYQSVSGAGRKAIDELYHQSKGIISVGNVKPEIFSKQIAFNLIPAIGDIYKSGVTDEEDKISREICKILKSGVRVAVTCVRVPVFIGHAMTVACEFSSDSINEKDARMAFANFDGIITIDRRDEIAFATPTDIQGEDSVYVSRIRKDQTIKNGLIYWVVADNLRKGAALNSVQIVENIISIDSRLDIFKKNIH